MKNNALYLNSFTERVKFDMIEDGVLCPGLSCCHKLLRQPGNEFCHRLRCGAGQVSHDPGQGVNRGQKFTVSVA